MYCVKLNIHLLCAARKYRLQYRWYLPGKIKLDFELMLTCEKLSFNSLYFILFMTPNLKNGDYEVKYECTECFTTIAVCNLIIYTLDYSSERGWLRIPMTYRSWIKYFRPDTIIRPCLGLYQHPRTHVEQALYHCGTFAINRF